MNLDYPDEYIADLIAEGCKENRFLDSFKGSELKRKSTGSDINKNFLKNTILSTESHNRREEIADCWREYDLSKKTVNVKKSKVVHEPNVDKEINLQLNEREYWASEKLRKINELNEKSSTTMNNDSVVLITKTDKKSKKEKKEKKEKKKKKKKPDKREKNDKKKR